MSRPTGAPKGAKGSGVIKWKLSDDAVATRGVRELATLLQELSRWPLHEFSKTWWSGDYRLLKLTNHGPVDVDTEITCQCSAAAEFMEVSVTTSFRSRGKARALAPSEQAALSAVGFGGGPGGGADLVHLNIPGQEADLARRILQGISEAFSTRNATTLKYTVTSGSRLDSMPVFQNIHSHELLALVRASQFDARLDDDGGAVYAGKGPTILVDGQTRFSMELIEPGDEGYLTIDLHAVLPGGGSSEIMEALNRALQIGAATLEDGVVTVRHRVSLTGGVSHAGVRDRIDEWVSSLAAAAQFMASQVSSR